MSRSRALATPSSGRRRGGARALAPPGLARRVRRPGARQGAARDRARRGASAAARRSTTCCSPGRPGLGKTSLAQIIRRELDVSIRQVAGPALERKGDIAAILTALEPRDVLFVDEIHRLNRAVEEILYPALEDFRLDIIVGQGPAARTLTLDLPPFTLVGATTRTGLLTTPLRDRFGLTFRLDHYSAGGARRRSCAAARGSSASRSSPTPPRRSPAARAARRGSRTASCAACATSPRCGTPARSRRRSPTRRSSCSRSTRSGLERFDRELLAAVAVKFGGGPVGLSTLAVVARRGGRDDRGRLRAVSAPARPPPADAARPHAHRARPRRRSERRPPTARRSSEPMSSQGQAAATRRLRAQARLGGTVRAPRRSRAGRGLGRHRRGRRSRREADLDRALARATDRARRQARTRPDLRAVLRPRGGDRAARCRTRSSSSALPIEPIEASDDDARGRGAGGLRGDRPGRAGEAACRQPRAARSGSRRGRRRRPEPVEDAMRALTGARGREPLVRARGHVPDRRRAARRRRARLAAAVRRVPRCSAALAAVAESHDFPFCVQDAQRSPPPGPARGRSRDPLVLPARADRRRARGALRRAYGRGAARVHAALPAARRARGRGCVVGARRRAHAGVDRGRGCSDRSRLRRARIVSARAIAGAISSAITSNQT